MFLCYFFAMIFYCPYTKYMVLVVAVVVSLVVVVVVVVAVVFCTYDLSQ